MRSSLRSWCHHGTLPEVGDLLDLEELDALGAPTGRRVRARVEQAPDGPRRPSSTQRLFAVDVPRDPPRMCVCKHVRLLHDDHGRGLCTLCGELVCSQYTPLDPREEP